MLQEAPSGYEKQRLGHSRGMSYLVISAMAKIHTLLFVAFYELSGP